MTLMPAIASIYFLSNFPTTEAHPYPLQINKSLPIVTMPFPSVELDLPLDQDLAINYQYIQDPIFFTPYTFLELLRSIFSFCKMVINFWADMDRYENTLFVGTVIVMRLICWMLEGYLELTGVKYADLSDYETGDVNF